MTNPDREELFTPDELAVRLDEWANCLDKSQWDLRSDVHCAAIHLRRLASSDGGVKVRELAWSEREGVTGTFDANTSIGHYIATITDDDRGMWFIVGQTTGEYMQPDIYAVRAAAQADYEARIKSALVTAPPADAGMREALAFTREFIRGEQIENAVICIGSMQSLGEYIDAALTAPCATTESPLRPLEREFHPGDHMALLKAVIAYCDMNTIQKITTRVIEARGNQSDGGGGSRPALKEERIETTTVHEDRTTSLAAVRQKAGVAPGPSDPSSTRSDVTVESLAYHVRRAIVDNYPPMQSMTREIIGDIRSNGRGV